ncbi:MAG: 30S ribosomal protein S4e [Candidatus Njordarchaeales archaeon]
MTKHGPRRQLKRIAAPKLFPIPRKVGGKFTIKPSPGPHPADRCIPLGIIIRDILGYARTLREVKFILNQRIVKIDGRVITDYKFPVGLMDVLEIERTKEYYRTLPFRRKLVLHRITPEEAKYKIVKIIGKRYVKNANIQLNLEDGRNILFKVSSDEERRKILDTYFVGDSLMISLPEQKILGHFRLKEGMYALITAGRHMGEHGTIKEITKMFGPRASTATIETVSGEEIITALDYVLVIGEDKPAITLPSEEEVREIMKRVLVLPSQ